MATNAAMVLAKSAAMKPRDIADKLAARKAWRRVPETTLLVLGLAGGWPGAILGQQCFRHKTQKQPFRTWFFISVALNVAALAGLYAVYSGMLSR